MKILISTRHIDVAVPVREVIEQKIGKALRNIADDVNEVNVLITREKSRETVELKVSTSYTTFRCEEETHDLMQSVDKAVDVLERQVRRNKEKFQTKRRKPKQGSFDSTTIPEDELEPVDVTELEIIKSNRFAPKPMSVDEALMQLKLSDDQFIVFSNSVTNEVNVIYLRKDGKVGLIEPDF